jgi:pimeloyl-ACP methyl ester carboxylesterase
MSGCSARPNFASRSCLVLIGAEEMLYDSRLALQRALAHMPNVEGELLEGASHLLIMERPEEVSRRLLAFLAPGDAEALVHGDGSRHS